MTELPGRRLKRSSWMIGALLVLALAACGLLPTPSAPVEIPAESRISALQAGRTSLSAGEQTDIRVGVVRVMNTEEPLTFQWSATGGDIVYGQGTCCITYQAPQVAGNYEVQLAVQYGPDLVQRTVTVQVLVTPTPAEPTPTFTPVIPAATPLPTDLPLPDAQAYFDRAQEYYFKRDYPSAIADFSRTIELGYEPLNEAYYQRGYMYYVQRDYKPAIEDFSKAIELNYDPAGLVYYNRGNAHYYSGANDQAIADYTRAIELGHEPLSWLYNSRGLAYRKIGAYEQAIADYTQAIERGHEPLHLPYFNRGNAQADKGAYAQAIADYTEAIRLDPELVDAYYARGLAHRQLGDTAAATADFQQVLAMNSDYWRQQAEQQLQELAGGG